MRLKTQPLQYFAQIRESPDGGNSSILDGWKSRSGRGSVAFDCDDAMTNGSSGDGLERDIIMEFVIQEEMENQKRSVQEILNGEVSLYH